MNKLIRIMLLILGLVMPALAQNPGNFHIIYGNRDGSTLNVALGDTIEIPCWGATSPPGHGVDSYDSVVAIHNPLLTDNNIIGARLGGNFIGSNINNWDDRSFVAAKTNIEDPTVPVGFTNQSIFALAYLSDPRDAQYFIFTGGDTVLLGTYLMAITSNPSYVGQTVCPLSEGNANTVGVLLWSMQDGVRDVTPTQTYGCIFIGPPPCTYLPGDSNGDNHFNGLDVTYSLNYLKGFGLPPPNSCDCGNNGMLYVAADANGSCGFNGSDIVYSINYLKGFGGPPLSCPDCPPTGR